MEEFGRKGDPLDYMSQLLGSVLLEDGGGYKEETLQVLASPVLINFL